MATIEITNEAELLNVYNQIEDKQFDYSNQLVFKGWPKYEITIKGESFNGGVPTRIMPAFIKLQQAINQTYAEYKYGDKNHKLTDEDKQHTELVVHLKKGSTSFEAKASDIINNITTHAIARMTPEQITLTIIAISILFTTGYMFKIYSNRKLKEKKIDANIHLSDNETRKMEIMAKLATDKINNFVANTENAQQELLKNLHDNDTVIIDNQNSIDGALAKKIARKTRENPDPIESRMDGLFIIISVDSGNVRGGYRLKVRSVDTKEEFTLKVPDGTLTEKQIETLQTGEWQKQKINMQLNIRKNKKRIIDGTLIEAGLIQ